MKSELEAKSIDDYYHKHVTKNFTFNKNSKKKNFQSLFFNFFN